MSQPWPYPGARWWKFDFHTHTPASRDTGAWRAAIGTSNELTPQTWLLKYMAAGIDCVAITDHNTGEWIDKLKAAGAVLAPASRLIYHPDTPLGVQLGVLPAIPAKPVTRLPRET